MALLVVLFGALVAAVGVAGLVRPESLVAWIDLAWRSGRGLPLAVAIRLVMGALLIAAAPECRFPLTIRVLGFVALAAALLLPLVGAARLQILIDWWKAGSPVLVRAAALFALAFGGFLVYAGS